MIEIELFYKTVESEIRRLHIKYLKKQKCLPAGVYEQLSNGSAAQSPADEAEALSSAAGEKAKYVKRYNQGVDMALKVLEREFNDFVKRLVKPERGVKP
ncbi:MAG: hypothetical protein K2N47_05595 [Clostridia bacterium]|nr:hypothetical protein [Clostridia bacterium]